MSFFLQPISDTRKSYSSGQVLIEVLIATSVLTVGFLGIITLLNRSLSLNRIIADNVTGNYLAAEGVEVVKNIIDTNVFSSQPWNQGVYDGCYELSYDSTSLTLLDNTNDCSNPSLSIFQRARPLIFDETSNTFRYGAGGAGDASQFRRIVKIETKSGNNEIQVNSLVRWTTRAAGVYTINIEDHFYNWR